MAEIYKANSSNSPKSLTFYGTEDEFRNFKKSLSQFAKDNIKKD